MDVMRESEESMLLEFHVKNFKNFKDELILDLSRTNNYEFSEEAVQDGVVKTALIYGENASGKTNLGYAIFDLILHLTDKEKASEDYSPYANLEHRGYVEFYYKFRFGEHILEYSYRKSPTLLLVKEDVEIDGKRVIFFDYRANKGEVLLKGAENLNTDLAEKNISFVKYIARNTVLDDNDENNTFETFIDFVEHMLMFSSLAKNSYQGFTVGSENIGEGIIERGYVKEFQEFLASVGIKYELVAKEIDGSKRLFCRFGKRDVSFFRIASRGTSSLALFYYWLIQMKEASFVFIDEFDAFYHDTLAEQVVRELLAMEHTQALFTTHNTAIMTNDLLRPDCYMQIVDGQIRSFADSTEKELRKAHNLRKMYQAGAFDGK